MEEGHNIYMSHHFSNIRVILTIVIYITNTVFLNVYLIIYRCTMEIEYLLLLRIIIVNVDYNVLIISKENTVYCLSWSFYQCLYMVILFIHIFLQVQYLEFIHALAEGNWWHDVKHINKRAYRQRCKCNNR